MKKLVIVLLALLAYKYRYKIMNRFLDVDFIRDLAAGGYMGVSPAGIYALQRLFRL